MTKRRHYRLLCPIARALDVLGDRWTLLILRDLHAGPARFQELHEGLGIATNLLSTRLAELSESGMIERSNGVGYQLTDAGRRTDRVLWELTRFGAGIPARCPPPRTRQPPHDRTTTPHAPGVRSPTDRTFAARLIVDDAEFTIISTARAVDVEWGPTVDPVDIVVRTSYEAFLDVGEGRDGIGRIRGEPPRRRHRHRERPGVPGAPWNCVDEPQLNPTHHHLELRAPSSRLVLDRLDFLDTEIIEISLTDAGHPLTHTEQRREATAPECARPTSREVHARSAPTRAITRTEIRGSPDV